MGVERIETRIDRYLLEAVRERAAEEGKDEEELMEEAVRRYLLLRPDGNGDEETSGVGGWRQHLRGVGRGVHRRRRLAGVPDEEAQELPEGATLSEAVLAERGESDF